MHSFAYTLIAAALATLSNAAPIILPDNLPVSVPSVPAALPASVPIPDVPNSSLGSLSSVEGQVESVTDIVRLRDVNSKIPDAVKAIQSEISEVHAREATPSVAVIFNNILTEIQPHTEQLTYLVSSNLTVTEVTSIVASIKAPIVKAVPELQVLVGLDASVILAPADGVVGDLTVSQIATIVSGDLELVFAAAGRVIDVVDAKGGDIVAEVKDILVDLGNTVTGLVRAVVPLVDGLAASLVPSLAPVDSVISDLGLVDLTVLLGLTL